LFIDSPPGEISMEFDVILAKLDDCANSYYAKGIDSGIGIHRYPMYSRYLYLRDFLFLANHMAN